MIPEAMGWQHASGVHIAAAMQRLLTRNDAHRGRGAAPDGRIPVWGELHKEVVSARRIVLLTKLLDS